MAIDMSGLTAPKRKATTTARKTVVTTPTADTRSLREMREQGLSEWGQIGQGLLLVTGNMADAGAVGMYWPAISRELAVLADTNDMIASVTDLLVKTGPYTALLTAVLPLGMQIAANHRLVSAAAVSGFGVVAPEVLEARMMTEVMEQQAAALRQQQDAQDAMMKARQALVEAQGVTENIPAQTVNGSV